MCCTVGHVVFGIVIDQLDSNLRSASCLGATLSHWTVPTLMLQIVHVVSPPHEVVPDDQVTIACKE
jgi:hypothetical protein